MLYFLALAVHHDRQVLPEAARIIIPDRLRIPESLQDRIGQHDCPLDGSILVLPLVKALEVMGQESETFLVDFSLARTRLSADDHSLAAVLQEEGFDHLRSDGIQMGFFFLEAVNASIVTLDDVLDVLVLQGVRVELGDHEVGVDSNESVLHIGVDLSAQETRGEMLQDFRLIDDIILHQIGARDLDGHRVAVVDVRTLTLDGIAGLQSACDDILEDLLDDGLDELLVPVQPDRLPGHHPGLLHFHRLFFNLN